MMKGPTNPSLNKLMHKPYMDVAHELYVHAVNQSNDDCYEISLPDY